jgi:HSP20 family protein
VPRFFRLFPDLFEDVWEPLERIRVEFPKAERVFAPACDVYEKGENVVVRCQIPGVKPEEVDIEVREDSVVLKGERKEEKEVKKENYYRRESAYGSFYRTIPLPVAVKTEKASAEFEDGVLKLTIPKAAPAKKVKVVKVKVKKK